MHGPGHAFIKQNFHAAEAIKAFSGLQGGFRVSP